MGFHRRRPGTPGSTVTRPPGRWVLVLLACLGLLMPLTALAATGPAQADAGSSPPDLEQRVYEVASQLR